MDIYFTKEWGLVNQLIEEGEPREFTLRSPYGTIHSMFILRPIPQKVDGKTYYDITTPYGYGGPWIETEERGRRTELLADYEEQFGDYCRQNDIVSEFVRFQPVAGNGRDFAPVYHSLLDRHTVGTDLTGDDPIGEEFSRSARKSVRAALKAGASWRVIEHPTDVTDFVRVYYSTMDRDNAREFYYFPREYFEKCVELFGDRIILVEVLFEGKVIAAGFYILSDGVIHAHLSGTLKEYIHLSPAYITKYATALWGKEHGYRLVHYGGGTSRAPDNSLYLFKRKFTRETLFDFYMGKKVWNREIYDRLCQLRGVASHGERAWEADFFPEYRS